MSHSIFIVDDNVAARNGIRATMKSLGLAVYGEACDGLDGVEKAW